MPSHPETSEISFDKPSLFEGVAQILTASINPNKRIALNGWLGDLNIINSSNVLLAEPIRASGEEPDWDSAVKVSRHKVDCLVEAIKGQPGGNALCFGSDVVFWLQDQPLLNLSRKKEELTGPGLEEELFQLQRIFSEPTVARWDVALSFSRKGTKQGTGIRATVADIIRVYYDPIDPALVRELFVEDIPGALGRNTRIPLIDDPRLQQLIQAIEIIPAKALVDSKTGELKERQDCLAKWVWQRGNGKFDEIVRVASREIVGGLPRRQRLDSALTLKPTVSGINQWKMV